MLTILGYSINDTIVVYDRVRENFQKSLKLNTTEVINDAINQTLSRTVLTSCLTLTVVASLYLFGGDYLHGFSLALLIGIIIGTYSSIYIAGSLALKLGLKRQDLIPTPEPTGEIYES
jgi:preprotein translocase subunit SecF